MAKKRLTAKQLLFIDAYLANGGNGTQAAKTAGYKGSDAVLAQVAYENLRKPEIQEAINERLKQFMSADEVLYRLSEIANADLGDLLDEEGRLDLVEAKKQKRTRFLKSIKMKSGATNEIGFEQYSRMEALELLGKHHKLFTEKHEHTGADGAPLKIIFEEVSGSDR